MGNFQSVIVQKRRVWSRPLARPPARPHARPPVRLSARPPSRPSARPPVHGSAPPPAQLPALDTTVYSYIHRYIIYHI